MRNCPSLICLRLTLSTEYGRSKLLWRCATGHYGGVEDDHQRIGMAR